MLINRNWRVAEPIKNVPMYNCAVFDVDKREFFVTSCDIPALERWKVRYICEKYNGRRTVALSFFGTDISIKGCLESLNSTEPVVNSKQLC